MSKQGNEHKTGGDALSAILGAARERRAPDAGAPASGGPMDGEFDGESAGEFDGQDGGNDAAGMAGAGEGFDDQDFDKELLDGLDGDHTPQLPPNDGTRTRRAARLHRLRHRRAGSSGWLARMTGVLLLAGGLLVEVLAVQGRLPSGLTAQVLHPTAMFALGTVLLLGGIVRRQLAMANARIDEMVMTHEEGQREVQEHLQFLVQHQHFSDERPPAKGEELERVLLVLERQGEKVNNLSRALKMYGKPLMELANQSADLAGQVHEVKSHVEAVLGALRQGLSRMESGGGEVDLAPLRAMTEKLADELHQSLASLGERLPEKSGLQQQLVRLEAGIQALSQRADDSEMRKSLVRLEDAAKLQHQRLDQVARTETLAGECEKLERQIDNVAGRLMNTIEHLRERNLGNLESGVRDVQRELAGLCTATAYIQQAVKSVGGRAAQGGAFPEPVPIAPAAAAAAPAAPAAAPTAAPAGRKRAAQPPQEPAGGGEAGAEEASPGAAYRTGKRASSGKNVLGAIAKLKNMKR